MKYLKVHTIVIVVFILLLWLPLMDMKFHVIKTINTEKRELAEMPTFKENSVSTFVTEYEKYFNDNFGFRSSLIFLYNLTQVKLFHTSPVQKVMIGTNGWLFYNSEAAGDDHSIDDYEGKVGFTQQELQKITTNLEHIQNTLSKRNITFLVFVAPNKSSIYEEYLPSTIRAKKGRSRYDQVYELLKSDVKINSIDMRDGLLQHKRENQLYYKTDTHWNSYGSFFAYQSLLHRLHDRYPQISAYTLDDYTLNLTQSKGNDDLAEMLGLQGQFVDQNMVFTPIHTIKLIDISQSASRTVIKQIPGSSLPKILVFRDSFFTAVEPFVSRTFSTSTYIWTSYDQSVVDREHPDIVVWEVAERYMDRLLK